MDSLRKKSAEFRAGSPFVAGYDGVMVGCRQTRDGAWKRMGMSVREVGRRGGGLASEPFDWRCAWRVHCCWEVLTGPETVVNSL